MTRSTLSLFILYSLLFTVYAFFSYALTAPNLILSSNEVFWKFQTYMWATFFNDRQLLSFSYAGLISLICLIYYLLIKKLDVRNSSLTSNFFTGIQSLLTLVVFLPLLFSNNALSYDVFNYIFNAKMVLVYHANPHVKVALDYAYDDWTRFMHNTHTPAPYGYGWTLFSLLPYILGLGKFLLTWSVFRLFSVLSILLLFLTYKKADQQYKLDYFSLIAIIFNPLLLIEVISNSHNDLWMMVPALYSLLIINSDLKKNKWLIIFVSGLLLAFSISTKFATAILMPIWLVLLIAKFRIPNSKIIEVTRNHWPLISSFLMFLPLLLPRSQQFHPWYLTWVLVWLPLIKPGKVTNIWRNFVLTLSISSLFRYLPYLWFGEYGEVVLSYQKIITWVPAILVLIYQTFRATNRQ